MRERTINDLTKEVARQHQRIGELEETIKSAIRLVTGNPDGDIPPERASAILAESILEREKHADQLIGRIAELERERDAAIQSGVTVWKAGDRWAYRDRFSAMRYCPDEATAMERARAEIRLQAGLDDATTPLGREMVAGATEYCDRAERDALKTRVAELERAARLYYHADGTVEELESPEAVVERRREAAKRIAELERGRDELLEACKAARAFGSQGETHNGESVSEMLRAAIAKAEGKGGGEG